MGKYRETEVFIDIYIYIYRERQQERNVSKVLTSVPQEF